MFLRSKSIDNINTLYTFRINFVFTNDTCVG